MRYAIEYSGGFGTWTSSASAPGRYTLAYAKRRVRELLRIRAIETSRWRVVTAKSRKVVYVPRPKSLVYT